MIGIHHDFEPASIVWTAQACDEPGLIESLIALAQTTGSVSGTNQMHTSAEGQTGTEASRTTHEIRAAECSERKRVSIASRVAPSLSLSDLCIAGRPPRSMQRCSGGCDCSLSKRDALYARIVCMVRIVTTSSSPVVAPIIRSCASRFEAAAAIGGRAAARARGGSGRNRCSLCAECV